MSLINEGKFGYDAVGHVLRLPCCARPSIPDPEADRGHKHFSFRALSASGGLESRR